jgi:hypothetical protein
MTEKDLEELIHELKTQDNLATAHPLYVVQEQREIAGMDLKYAERWKWHSEDHEYCYSDDEIQAAIQVDVEDEFGEAVSDCDEHVTVHLTMKAAQRYLEENRHNLAKPRIFVESQYRCHEWNELVDALKRGELVLAKHLEIAVMNGRMMARAADSEKAERIEFRRLWEEVKKERDELLRKLDGGRDDS